MEFSKNTEIVQNICLVQIRSVDNTVDIPNLTTIYHTPSKITLTGSSKNTENGVLISKKLSLQFPGLATGDFDKFQDLTRGAFQVYVKTDSGDIYEVASQQFFMECDSTFNIKTGHVLNFSASHPIPIKFRENQSDDGINVAGFDYDFDFYLR